MQKPDRSISRLFSKSNLKPVVQDWRLRCLIKGENVIFWVTVPGDKDISELKEIIHGKANHGVLKGINEKDLVLLKVRNISGSGIDIPTNSSCSMIRLIFKSIISRRILLSSLLPRRKFRALNRWMNGTLSPVFGRVHHLMTCSIFL